MRHLRLGCALAALIAPVAIPAAAYAQETSSAIRGQVLDDANQAVPNATVVVTHTPSGTKSTQTTDAEGNFNAAGLRLGGPYTIAVTAPGFDPASETVANLTAGVPQRLEVFLAQAGQTITVTAARQRSAITIDSGPATVLSSADISTIANTSRDVRNLAVRSPFVALDPTNGGAISILGQNNRFNRFTVDGVQFGDPFGLEAGGLASSRGPVPLDAIQEFSVEVAPVDIQQGFFQGGAINTQLKSGTNQLHGTGFFTYSSDAIAGEKARDSNGSIRNFNRSFESRNYGVQLTGPIIKDKLFFAVTWERLRDQTPATNDVPLAAFNAAPIDQVTQIANSVYSYDPLAIATNVSENDDKVVAKVDWNIADGHRLALTYIYNEGNILAGLLTGQANQTSPTITLQSNNYSQGSINHYGVLQLNDQWTDSFSTQLRVSYNDYTRLQAPYNGTSFGQFQVCGDAASVGTGSAALTCSNGVARVQFGPDASRQANQLYADTLGIEFQARLKRNDHDVKLIVEHRGQNIYNLFAQNVSGSFYFDSVADLQNRRANQLIYAAPITGDINTVAAIFENNVWTIGLQDTWDATDTLSLTAGFRYDLFQTPDVPVFNQAFVNRNGFPNNDTLNGRSLFQPRAALAWNPTDRLKLRVSGGLYGGGNPNVWISNSYSNPGPLLGRVTINRVAGVGGAADTYTVGGVTLTAAQQNAIGAAALNNVSGGTGIPGTIAQVIAGSGAALATTNAIDPNFRPPSQWRVAGSVDYSANFGPLGDDWNLGADVVWSRVKDALTWTDLRSVPTGLVTPDGRPRYNAVAANDTNNDILLTNTGRGYSWNVVARIDKRWDFGLSVGAAYTFNRTKDLNPGTSSVAFSNYVNAVVGNDPNNAQYGTSNYQIDDAYRLNVGYRHAFFGENNTTFQLFFNSRAGQRYSYTFNDLTQNRSAVFGVGGTGTNQTNRYGIYVPNVSSATADPLVTYATGFDFTGFQSFVQKSPLNKYQGRIAPKNLGSSPRFDKLDLHFGQELPLPLLKGAKFEAFADMENFLNFLDSKLGNLRQVAFPYYGTLVNVSCAQASGAATTSPAQACARYVYANRTGTTFAQPALATFSPASFWQVRVGARVSF